MVVIDNVIADHEVVIILLLSLLQLLMLQLLLLYHPVVPLSYVNVCGLQTRYNDTVLPA